MSSPTVTTSTINKSFYQPHFTNEIGAYVGYFEKGPINQPVFITSVNEFKFIFGRGIDLYHNDWYQVYNYLQYSTGIWVVRASGNQQWNANNGEVININSIEDWENNYSSINVDNYVRVISKTPGEAGNLLSVVIFSLDQYLKDLNAAHGFKCKQLFSYFEDNHIGIVVFRNGKIVEKFYESSENVLTNNIDSKYCYFKFDVTENDNIAFIDEPNLGYNFIQLEKGSTNFATDDDFYTAHEILKEKDSYDIDIIIGNQYDNSAAVDVANYRKDCIAFIGIPTKYITFLKTEVDQYNDVLYTEDGRVIALTEFVVPRSFANIDKQRLDEYINLFSDSEFVHFTANIKLQKDGFTNKSKLVNVAADIAGLKAQASLVSPWTPGAGLERGLIKNADDFFIKFDEKYKKRLYQKGLNFIESGFILSQKTFTTRPTAFGRVNVRSLFNHLEKTVERTLRKYVFEENREGVRRTIAIEIKNILRDIQSNKGIEAGRVEVHKAIDNDSTITVDVYVKPTYVTEFIRLRMINTGSNTISSIVSNTLG